MRKLILSVAIVIAAISAGCKNNQSISHNPNDTLLWSISGKGLKDTSYLFGTHHLFSPNFLKEVKGFDRVFNKINKVYIEAPDSTIDPRYIAMTEMPEDTTYKVLYSAEDYEFITKTLKTQMLDSIKIKPNMLAFIIALTPSTSKLRLFDKSGIGLDRYIEKKARESRGLSIGYMESFDDQEKWIYIDILKINEPLEKQAENLLSVLKNKDSITATNDKFIWFYSKQQLTKIEQYFDEWEKMDPKLSRTILKERNKKWIVILDKYLQNKHLKEHKGPGGHPTLVAVGAGHLVGENGLINQLRKMGYTVEPVLK